MRASHAEGMGPAHQREGANLEEEKEEKKQQQKSVSVCVCVKVKKGASFDWTHSCFDIDGPGRVEEDRLPQRTE